MKKICAFTLENEDVPSRKFGFDLRLIAYLMYDYVYNYDKNDYVTALNINKNIVYNRIREGSIPGEYFLESDDNNNEYINYEPFIIGNKTFAFTVYDDRISEEELYKLLNQVLRLIGKNYKFVLNTETYFSKNMDDEKYRKYAINSLRSRIGCGLIKRNVFSRKRVLNNNMRVSFGGR